MVENPLDITSTTTGLSTSFAGGQTVQIQAAGLTNDILLGRAQIRICEKPCQIIEAESTAHIFACSTPAVATKKSNEEFKI